MKSRKEHAYVLNVMAEDRPGIVAAVSKAVVEADGNVDACSQTVLSGYFTLIMVVSFSAELPTEKFTEQLMRPRGRDSGMQVQIRPYHEGVARPELTDAENFVVTVFGPDLEGVIYHFSLLLAEKGINIVDLYGHLNDGQFVLISQVQIPRRWDLAMLQADLEQLGQEMNFTVKLQHENIFIATNQLRLGRMSSSKSQ